MSVTTFLWVVVYEVGSPRAHRGLRETLQYWGKQIRPCVYEVCTTTSALEEMIRRMSPYLEESDTVRIYRLCSDCRTGTRLYGDAELESPPIAIII